MSEKLLFSVVLASYVHTYVSAGDPTLNLKNLMDVLVDLEEWEQLGVALGIKARKIKTIAMAMMASNGHVERCKYSLMDHWLKSDSSASWQKLIEALQSEHMKDDYGDIVMAINARYGAEGS